MLTILILFLPSETEMETLQKKTSDIHSTTTTTTASISNEKSTNVFNFSHDDFLKMLDINNNSFKKELESSFKNEVAEKLFLNNLAISKNFNQRFSSFQTVMLQTIKNIVLQMIPNFLNNNNKCNPNPSKTHSHHSKFFLHHPFLHKVSYKHNLTFLHSQKNTNT